MKRIVADIWRNNFKYNSRKLDFTKFSKVHIHTTRTLDLGSGITPQNPFNAQEVFGLDICDVELENVAKCDLALDDIPWENDSLDFVTAFDLLEHIPRLVYVNGVAKYSFIDLLNEVYRVLKKGGVFLASTPCYPHSAAFVDPTHVNFITTETFPKYFAEPYIYARRYGFCGSFILHKQYFEGDYLVVVLEKK